VHALLGRHAELAEALAHPALPAAKKRGLVRAALEQKVQAPVLRLLELLVERGRVSLLPANESAYTALFNAQRGVAQAEVVSAAPLSPDERRALQAALERASGLGVELALHEDPALLGGLLVRLGGRSYDGSVRGRLRALRALLGAGPAA
jgi:F-type H+-transporting ATPase subunit delta